MKRPEIVERMKNPVEGTVKANIGELCRYIWFLEDKIEKAVEMAEILQLRYHHSHFSHMKAKRFLKSIDDNGMTCKRC